MPKPKPMEAFKANMADAHHLVLLAECLTNHRVRRMRSELRRDIGTALDIRVKKQDQLDCIQSPDVFLMFLPGSRISKGSLKDHRPLLRQALVAACAATETYIADKVCGRISELTTSPEAATKNLKEVRMTVEDWLKIEQRYQRRRRGLHLLVIEEHVRKRASTSPTTIGELMSLVGVEKWSRKLDGLRGVKAGATVELLERITLRRNKIVHTGDRQGRSRAGLTIDEVKGDLDGLESVVTAIEKLLLIGV